MGIFLSDQQGGVTLTQLWGLFPRLIMEGWTQWLYMTCLHYWISRSEHQGMTWLNYIINTFWNKHQGIIHKIYKWMHSKVTNTSTWSKYLYGPKWWIWRVRVLIPMLKYFAQSCKNKFNVRQYLIYMTSLQHLGITSIHINSPYLTYVNQLWFLEPIKIK